MELLIPADRPRHVGSLGGNDGATMAARRGVYAYGLGKTKAPGRETRGLVGWPCQPCRPGRGRRLFFRAAFGRSAAVISLGALDMKRRPDLWRRSDDRRPIKRLADPPAPPSARVHLVQVFAGDRGRHYDRRRFARAIVAPLRAVRGSICDPHDLTRGYAWPDGVPLSIKIADRFWTMPRLTACNILIRTGSRFNKIPLGNAQSPGAAHKLSA